MKTWKEARLDEYGGSYSVNGDKVYVEKVEIESPIYNFPLYDRMEGEKETWLVYGVAVRTFLSNSFSLGGHHYVFPFIKPSEIWIESNTYEEERSAIYMKQVIVRFLMRDLKLSLPEALIVGNAYSIQYQSEQYKTGNMTLKSFYPKKNAYVVDYAPPQRREFEQKKNWVNTELNQFQAAKELLQQRKELQGPEWEEIYKTLGEYEEDLSKLPI